MKFYLQKNYDHNKAVANKLKKELLPIQVGDKLWLIRRNIKTTRSCDKLDYQKLGPFPIQQVN